VADRPGDIRARRNTLDPASFDGETRRALLAFRAVTTIDTRRRLMVAPPLPGGPPAWADMALLPPSGDAAATAALARQLRHDGWFRPDVAGRVALGLPADTRQQVEAIRQSQRQGAAAFALCPQAPALPPPSALSQAFSANRYPYRP
jgi:hypothetical protein